MSDAQAQEMTPAGFWLRAGAYMIDIVVLLAMGFACGILGGLIHVPALGMALAIIAGVLYFTAMLAIKEGQTLGKMAAGIAVVRVDGGPVGWGQALGRYLCYFLSSILSIGFLIAAFTEGKRALHDYIAGTRVIVAHSIGKGRRACLITLGVSLPILATLAVLTAVTLPEYARTEALANEQLTKSSLSSLRTALAAYSADHRGQFPQKLDDLVPKYIAAIPLARISPQAPAGNITYYGPESCQGKTVSVSAVQDAGGWGYVGDPRASCAGTLFVSSTQNDQAGTPWYTY